jgi:hypothetical protein
MSIRGYSFVFALMKCSYAAFGEQNKTDNDSKCQQVYKSLIVLPTDLTDGTRMGLNVMV